MKFILLVFVFSVQLATAQDSTVVIGFRATLESKILKEKRDILISIPNRYKDSGDSYPVLILLDGSSHFNEVSTMVNYLADYIRIPQMIVVGLPNTDRIRDFMPLHSLTGLTDIADTTLFKTSGGGDNFVRFLTDELVPYLDKHYRTQPHRILMGHSLGGQFAVYAWQKSPAIFQSIISISPAFYGKNKNTYRTIPSFLMAKHPLKSRIYIAIGDEPTIQPGTDSLRLRLTKNTPDVAWTYKKYEHDDHGSVVPMAVHDALRDFYADWWINTDDPTNVLTYEDLGQRFKKLSLRFGYEITPAEQSVNAIGFQNLDLNHYDAAIKAFQHNATNFPRSVGAQFLLGMSYEQANNKVMALKAYEKAFTLNPTDKNIEAKLKELKK